MWTDTLFFNIPYTGLDASTFGGQTIVKASEMFTSTVLEVQQMEWSGVHILIIDEISFMTKHRLTKFDGRLHRYIDCNKVFGHSIWRLLHCIWRGLQTTHQRQ